MPQELLERKDLKCGAIRPFGAAVRLDDTAATALERMADGACDMLPVVADEGDARFAGIVLRKALQNGCVRMGHDPGSCRLHNHLKTDVAVMDAASETEIENLKPRTLTVVLDALGRAVGYVPADAELRST